MKDDEAHFAALGRVTAASTLMEDRIKVLAYVLISGDQITGQIVMAQLGFRSIVTLVMALANHRLPSSPLLQELAELVKQAETVQARRDTLVHSTWGDSMPTGRRRIKRTAKRKGLKWEFEPVAPSTMLSLANSIESLADRFDDLHARIRQSGLL